MYRDRDEVDETEEISLQDTQEYRLANADAEAETEIVEEPEGDFEDELADDPDYEEDPVFEDDDYTGDEYFEDEPDPGDRGEPQPREQVPGESVSGHLKAAGAVFAAHVKSIEVPKPRLPNMPKRAERPERSKKAEKPEGEKVEFEFGLVPGIAAIAIAAVVIGVGAFFIGKGSGDDVDSARLEGTAAGKQAGAIDGAAKGYAAGFQKGRDAGFDKAYIPAYKLNYKRALEQAGLDAPTDKEIDVPEP